MYLDWAALGREIQNDDHVQVDFRLDYLAIVSKPLIPIQIARGPLFETMSIHLGSWSKRYRASTPWSLPFPIERRAYYLGSSNRLQWFLIMKPAFGYVWPSDKAEKQKEIRQGVRKCAMSRDNARKLLEYIISICECHTELAKTGIDRRSLEAQAEWKNLGVDRQVDISRAQWIIFQELFCQNYPDHFSSLDEEHFFRTHEPTFHVYDYGQDLAVGNAIGQFDDHLVEQLSAEFNMDGVEMVGTALAMNVSVTDRDGHHLTSLADFRRCAAEFPVRSSRTFFPLGFSPRVGNVQSTEPPVSLLTDLLSG
ncbi:hypothetical protein V1506DRAFT_273372, partial [Lipomyces tetrasporus]